MFEVTVRDHMMVAHSLSGEVFGPARALHGATFVVDAAFAREHLDDDGIVLDIGRATEALHAILAEPSVSHWWGDPDPVDAIAGELAGGDNSALLVIEIGGEVAGGIQYHEEDDPMYRHAGIDRHGSERFDVVLVLIVVGRGQYG